VWNSASLVAETPSGEGFGDARRGARHHHALPGEQKARRLDERTVVVD